MKVEVKCCYCNKKVFVYYDDTETVQLCPNCFKLIQVCDKKGYYFSKQYKYFEKYLEGQYDKE